MRGAVLTGRATSVSRSATPEDRQADRCQSFGCQQRACVGSDLWPYRGVNPTARPTPMGHEYCGIVEDVAARCAASNLGSS